MARPRGTEVARLRGASTIPAGRQERVPVAGRGPTRWLAQGPGKSVTAWISALWGRRILEAYQRRRVRTMASTPRRGTLFPQGRGPPDRRRGRPPAAVLPSPRRYDAGRPGPWCSTARTRSSGRCGRWRHWLAAHAGLSVGCADPRPAMLRLGHEGRSEACTVRQLLEAKPAQLRGRSNRRRR